MTCQERGSAPTEVCPPADPAVPSKAKDEVTPSMVMVLGVDVHKDTHTTVVVDYAGREQALRTVRAIDSGHEQLVAWARREYPCERKWAVEDCRHVSTRLERALRAAGETVVRVPPKLMADARSGARTRGKSDPIDALAIARAALREPDLPVAVHDETSRELKLPTTGLSSRSPGLPTTAGASRPCVSLSISH